MVTSAPDHCRARRDPFRPLNDPHSTSLRLGTPSWRTVKSKLPGRDTATKNGARKDACLSWLAASSSPGQNMLTGNQLNVMAGFGPRRSLIQDDSGLTACNDANSAFSPSRRRTTRHSRCPGRSRRPRPSRTDRLHRWHTTSLRHCRRNSRRMCSPYCS